MFIQLWKHHKRVGWGELLINLLGTAVYEVILFNEMSETRHTEEIWNIYLDTKKKVGQGHW